MMGGLPVFLPSAQLSGAPCQTQVLVIRHFTTTCTCKHAIFMHRACVHVHMYMHTYALCGYTRHLRTCRYVAILVNRPSGISQAAAIAANRTQGVKNIWKVNKNYKNEFLFLYKYINNQGCDLTKV